MVDRYLTAHPAVFVLIVLALLVLELRRELERWRLARLVERNRKRARELRSIVRELRAREGRET